MDKKRFRKRALAVAAATVTTAAALSLGAGQAVDADTFSLETGRTVDADTFSLETGQAVNTDTLSLGDVNLDGKVDLKDAQLALRCSLHISSLDGMHFTGADVNLDNIVDLKDTQKILKGALNVEKIAGKNHTHNLKEHTATQQVWVSNMVTVDDYEDKVVSEGYYVCNCGKRFDYSETDALEEHAKTNMIEAALNGVKSECGGYMMYPEKVTERVKVGSHQEDHGHYETQTYVDYYYCDCGARK